ncbi:MAG: hypothetical protein IJI50_04425 [Ruminococcus sp.]|nr:hypothetical protein [Ruminococcus sp.]
MKSVYERENLKITEFDTEDVITTSGEEQQQQLTTLFERENAYRSFNQLDLPTNGSSWWW